MMWSIYCAVVGPQESLLNCWLEATKSPVAYILYARSTYPGLDQGGRTGEDRTYCGGHKCKDTQWTIPDSWIFMWDWFHDAG